MAGMKAEVKKLWVDALRSGDYKQVEGALRKDDQFCCLGVLCDVAVKNGVDLKVETKDIGWGPHDVIYKYGEEQNSDSLPDEVMAWAELDSADPEVAIPNPYPEDYEEGVDPEDYEAALSATNDDYGYDFARIADLIEGQL